jgi:ankyrin repeat protein
MLLRAGAQVNAADKFGATALHRAVSKGYMTIIETLLSQSKINVNAMDCEGNSPL